MKHAKIKTCAALLIALTLAFALGVVPALAASPEAGRTARNPELTETLADPIPEAPDAAAVPTEAPDAAAVPTEAPDAAAIKPEISGNDPISPDSRSDGASLAADANITVLRDADNSVYGFECQGVYYYINDNNTLTVVGYTITRTPEPQILRSVPGSLSEKGEDAPAEYLVTAIYRGAFANHTEITSVHLPEGLVYLSAEAFSGCTSLAEVYIPGTLMYTNIPESQIMRYGLRYPVHTRDRNPNWSGYPSYPSDGQTVSNANRLPTVNQNTPFSGCDNLKRVILADSMVQIPHSLFRGCPALETVAIPNRVTVIQQYAFANCAALRSVTFPEPIQQLTTIEANAFSGCTALSMIDSPDNIAEPDNHLPEGIAEIGQNAFSGCTALTNLTLSEGLVTLGNNAFSNCTALKSIYIPSTLTTATTPFGAGNNLPNPGCPALDQITFGENIAAIPATLFQNCFGLKNIEIPNTVASIGNNAFFNCVALTSVTFPDAEGTLASIGNSAFENCTVLPEIELPEGLNSIGNQAFAYCSAFSEITLPEGLTSLGSFAFIGCANLESAYIPSTLTTANTPFGGGRADTTPVFQLSCVKLDNITFGDNIPIIPAGLFAQCMGLTHMEIPDTVTNIGANAFSQCRNLKNITIPDSVTAIGEQAFYYAGLTSIEFPDSVTAYGNNLMQNCMYLTSAKLSARAFDLPVSMFRYCIALRSIELPNHMTFIRNSTFQECYTLESVTMPNTITQIQQDAFHDCKKLNNLILSANLNLIGQRAFQGCEALEEITIPDGVATIDSYAFQGNTELRTVKLPAAIVYIPSYAFANCPALAEINIPKGVTEIRDHAFYQDSALSGITLPITVTTIGNDALSYHAMPMTVRGVTGSYGETWAKQNNADFIDITKHVQRIYLSAGGDSVTIARRTASSPGLIVEPADTTDILTLSSSDENIVLIRNGNLLYGQNTGTATVTATASGGRSFSFTVSVEDISSLKIINRPARVYYTPGEAVNLSGLLVEAVFRSGARGLFNGWTATINNTAIENYRVSATGEQTVQIACQGVRTTFPITVYESEDDFPLWIASADIATNAARVTVTGNGSGTQRLMIAAYDANGRFIRAAVKEVRQSDRRRGYVDVSISLYRVETLKIYLTDRHGVPQSDRRFVPLDA